VSRLKIATDPTDQQGLLRMTAGVDGSRKAACFGLFKLAVFESAVFESAVFESAVFESAVFESAVFESAVFKRLLRVPDDATEADLIERLVNLFERLFAEVGDRQEALGRAFEQFPHSENTAFFQAIRGADRQSDLRGAQFKLGRQIASPLSFGAETNASGSH
jgi:uncharacterized protein YjbI with pentapeptide repeats